MARKELEVTVGATLRKAREAGAVVPFPSGNNYRVRIPGAAGMLKRGNLPNPLLSFALDAFYSGVTEEKYDAFLSAQERSEGALDLIASLRAVCQEMFMEPRVVDNPQADNEIAIDDVPLQDQLWAFRLAFAPSEVLYPFRDEPQADVVSVLESQDVPQATK